MVYYALLKGKGEGCDYTIGCNMMYQKLQVNNLEDAKAELNIIFEDAGGFQHEDGWEEVKLIEVTKEIDKIIPNKEWSDE